MEKKVSKRLAALEKKLKVLRRKDTKLGMDNCCPECGSTELSGIDEEERGIEESSAGSVECLRCGEISYCDNCERRSAADRKKLYAHHQRMLKK